MSRWLEFNNEAQKGQIRSAVCQIIICYITIFSNPSLLFCYVIFQFVQALQSQIPVVRHTAAQVIGAFGAADLPNKHWAELLPTLLSFVNTSNAPEGCKVASLEVKKQIVVS